MYDNAVDTCPFLFDSIPDQYITQKMCDKDVSEDSFMLKYCHDKYEISYHQNLFLIGLL